MERNMRVFIPQLTTFGVEDKFNSTNYIPQHWAVAGLKHKQKPTGQGYKRGKFGAVSRPTGVLGEDLPPVPLNPINNLLNSQVGGGHYQLPMNHRSKRSMMLYNQHLQADARADDFFQLPYFGNERGVSMYQTTQPTGTYNKWMKGNSSDATGGSKVSQNFRLTGQTPQGFVGYEGGPSFQYNAGSFHPTKHGGAFNTNRLQNAISSNRNRYFQHQFPGELPDSMSNRMLQGIQGGHFNSMDPQQQYSINRLYMNNNRRMPQSFKLPFNQGPHGNAYGPSSQYSFDSMLPNIRDRYRDSDMAEDVDGEEGNYRYKYNGKSTKGGDHDEYNRSDLIGKYAKYYRTQDTQKEQNKQTKAAPSSNNKNELVSRYLKHAAKKQVRSTSISVPKYTGDYDPDVFVTGKLQSRESLLSQSSLPREPSQEINKESLLNKQEAAAEQKFRLEKSNFPSPASLSNAATTDTASDKAKYKLKYTKRKKMLIASTSDKENDPSMLVKGGDDVTLGNDDEISEQQSQEKEAEATEQMIPPITPTTPIKPQEENENRNRANDYDELAPATKVPTAKKIIKKMRRLSVVPKSTSDKEADKKVEFSNKQQQQQQQTNKPKVTKTVDIKKQVKKVTIEKVKRTAPIVTTKNEEQNKEEETEENLSKLESIAEEEELSHLENDTYYGGGSEEELQFGNEEEDAEKAEQQKADDELNAILAPLRAQVPDHFRISPTLGFLPIMPVTFSWFPMSQQHKEAFKKMSEQSKFPNSLRPFQRFAAT